MSQSLTGRLRSGQNSELRSRLAGDTNASRFGRALVSPADSLLGKKTAEKQVEFTGHFGWILHPAIDLLLVCGGLAWLFFALHYFIAKPAMSYPLLQILAFTVLIGTHLLSETHTAATLVRAYAEPTERRRLSLYTEWGALACLTLLFAGLFIKGFTPIMAKVYLLLVVHHFTAQSYGLALLYCLKRGYKLALWEKTILQSIFTTTAIFAVVRQMVFKDWSPNGFLAQIIPFWGPLPVWTMTVSIWMLALSAVLCVLMISRKLICDRVMLPLPSALLMVTTVLMYTFDHNASGVVWLYIPAFFHGSQYVVISLAHYLKQRGFPEGMKPEQIGRLAFQSDGMKYLGFLLMGGIVIYIGLPRFLTEFGIGYTQAFAAVFCAVNLHHFLTDQAIWKLRNPKLRTELIN